MKFGGMVVSDGVRSTDLEEDNRRLKHLVVDLFLDKTRVSTSHFRRIASIRMDSRIASIPDDPLMPRDSTTMMSDPQLMGDRPPRDSAQQVA